MSERAQPPSTDDGRRVRVLVVEDGDEYLTNLTTFVAEGFFCLSVNVN